jgi:hypothetical protein
MAIKTIIPTVISCLYFTLNSDQFITNKFTCFLVLILLSGAGEIINKATYQHCNNQPQPT